MAKAGLGFVRVVDIRLPEVVDGPTPLSLSATTNFISLLDEYTSNPRHVPVGQPASPVYMNRQAKGAKNPANKGFFELVIGLQIPEFGHERQNLPEISREKLIAPEFPGRELETGSMLHCVADRPVHAPYFLVRISLGPPASGAIVSPSETVFLRLSRSLFRVELSTAEMRY